MGGMQSNKLDDLAITIWSWCKERSIFLTAVHVPGVENTGADYKSRIFNDSHEWMLKKDIFVRVCKQFFTPDVDLLASRLSHQISNYASWSFDPGASAVDAVTICWSNMSPYIFPPFSLISRILSKIKSDTVEKDIIIVPFWPTQSWFSLLISVIISLPVRLPRHKDLIVMPTTGETNPLLRKTDFIAAVLSGNLSEDISNIITSSWRKRTNKQYDLCWRNWVFGVVDNMPIPFIHLKI